MLKGSLTIVGSGIKAVSHFTVEAMMAIRDADIVFHVVADQVTEHWITTNAKEQKTLTDFYVPAQHRRTTYLKMKESIVEEVKKGRNVCALFYGHPGIFVNPSHAAAGELRREGYSVLMQPGISAEDCLFADLGIDPATNGCCSMEATQFLTFERSLDTSMPVILWQIGMTGNPTYSPHGEIMRTDVLLEKLLRFYPPTHKVCVYEAAVYSVSRCRCDWSDLGDFPKQEINGISTMYIPLLSPTNYDHYFLDKLHLQIDQAFGVQLNIEQPCVLAPEGSEGL
jgi:precorrin-6B methylase 1